METDIQGCSAESKTITSFNSFTLLLKKPHADTHSNIKVVLTLSGEIYCTVCATVNLRQTGGDRSIT